MQKISVIIITKNEEKNIEKCIKSVAWCDEVIVIDDNSTDKTIEIAKKSKATLYLRALDGDFASQRNFGMTRAKNDWILFVDADEIVSDALTYEISNAIQLKDQYLRDFSGFYIRRIDFMWGQKLKYGETGNAWRLRLAKKSVGQWVGTVHERWKVRGLVGKLVNPIFHYPHGGKLEEFIREVNFYTDIRAEEMKFKKVSVSYWDIILYPLGKFLLNYVFRMGFMDGTRGFIVAITMSFHSFLVRSKLWTMLNKS